MQSILDKEEEEEINNSKGQKKKNYETAREIEIGEKTREKED